MVTLQQEYLAAFQWANWENEFQLFERKLNIASNLYSSSLVTYHINNVDNNI